MSGLTAYYWDGGPPLPHRVRDISATGMYLLTEQRWYLGTLVRMTLQWTGSSGADSDNSTVAIQTRVVRICPDGVGLAFVLPQARKSDRRRTPVITRMDRESLEKFLAQLRISSRKLLAHFGPAQGQALIEYLLVLPMILLLIVNMVNFGGFFYAWITVANAARAGADYGIMGGASVGSPEAADAAQIISIITKDVSSLPNASSVRISICQNNNGTTKALTGTCSNMPTDPEPASYVLTTTDVTYTYIPFIPAGFQFPNLSVYATIPPTTIHRRAVMRAIQ